MAESIVAFVQEARQFCELVEDQGTVNSWAFAQNCLRSLLRLYDAALSLHATDCGTEEFAGNIAHDEWELMRSRIADRLQRDYYWVVFEPLEEAPPEPVCGSLSDDLADIWRDLKPGLMAIGDSVDLIDDSVIWEWRTSFETHWGQHAAWAIGALSALCFGAFADPNRPV